MLSDILKEADLSNFPNHITFYGDNFEKDVLTEEYLDYRKKWVEYPKNFFVSDFPLHLDIEVTNSCNIRCKMCVMDFTVDTGEFIDVELFKKVVDEGSRHGLASVKYNYRGEPLMHKHLVEMVEYTKKRGIIEAQFNTNATLLTEEKSEELINAGLDKIIISIDSINPAVYNSIRIGADFHKVLSNIRRFIEIRDYLKKRKPIVRVQMVCMLENQDEVHDFVVFWRKIVDQVGLIRFKKQRAVQDDQRIVDYSRYSKPCQQLYQRLVNGCDGKVTMCCGDTLRKVVLGDAYKTPVAEIWKGDTLNKIRKLHRENRYNEIAPCKTCSVNWHNKGEEWSWLPDLNK